MKKKITKYNPNFFSHAEEKLGRRSFDKAVRKGKSRAAELRLKSAREHLGLNQSQLAGLTQPEVSKIESRKDMKISTLEKYAKALGMRVRISLVTDDDETQQIPIYN